MSARNQSEDIYYFLANETLLELISSTIFVDGLYIFATTPINLAGLVLNILNIVILNKIKIKQTKLYEYLQLNSTISCLSCLIGAVLFTGFSARFYPNVFSLFSQIVRVYLAIYVFTTIYFVTNLLDIVVALERLSIFIKPLRSLFQLDSYKLFVAISAFSLLFNLPICFLYYMKSEQEILNELRTNMNGFAYVGRTQFYYTQINPIIIIIQILIRDVCTLYVEIVISCLSIYYHRTWSQKMVALMNQSDNQNNKASTSFNRRNEKGKQIMLMTIILSLMSIVFHLVVCVSYAFSIMGRSQALLISQSVVYLGVSLKHFASFFVFYTFNSNFKKETNSFFKKLCSNSN